MTDTKIDLDAFVRKGIDRCPEGPPASPFLAGLKDRMERIIHSDSHAQRDGIASALILSIRRADDKVVLRSTAVQTACEVLITASCHYIDVVRDAPDQQCAELFAMRGALNTVQAVYAAEFEPEDLVQSDPGDVGPSI